MSSARQCFQPIDSFDVGEERVRRWQRFQVFAQTQYGVAGVGPTALAGVYKKGIYHATHKSWLARHDAPPQPNETLIDINCSTIILSSIGYYYLYYHVLRKEQKLDDQEINEMYPEHGQNQGCRLVGSDIFLRHEGRGQIP